MTLWGRGSSKPTSVHGGGMIITSTWTMWLYGYTAALRCCTKTLLLLLQMAAAMELWAPGGAASRRGKAEQAGGEHGHDGGDSDDVGVPLASSPTSCPSHLLGQVSPSS